MKIFRGLLSGRTITIIKEFNIIDNDRDIPVINKKKVPCLDFSPIRYSILTV